MPWVDIGTDPLAEAPAPGAAPRPPAARPGPGAFSRDAPDEQKALSEYAATLPQDAPAQPATTPRDFAQHLFGGAGRLFLDVPALTGAVYTGHKAEQDVESLVTLPQRLMDAGAAYSMTGDQNLAIGPVMEAAMLTTFGPGAAEEGAVLGAGMRGRPRRLPPRPEFEEGPPPIGHNRPPEALDELVAAPARPTTKPPVAQPAEAEHEFSMPAPSFAARARQGAAPPPVTELAKPAERPISELAAPPSVARKPTEPTVEPPQAPVEPPKVYAPEDLHDLTSTSLLHADYPKATQRSDVRAVGKVLELRGQEALRRLGIEGGRIEGPSEVGDNIIAHSLAHEAMAALARSGNAANWYTTNVREAMDMAHQLHPEMRNDPLGEMGYIAALAITSQGERVASNLNLTEYAYDVYKRTGRFPLDIRADKQQAMNSNFAKLNRLLDTLGHEGTQRFLRSEWSVRDLERETGQEIAGENKDTMVYGSAIFGPKIGQGFFQNLAGNYSPTTFDMWWMRGWGRLTGNLIGKPEAVLNKQIAKFKDELKANRKRAPRDLEQLTEMARVIWKQHERDFVKYRTEYDSGVREKTALVKAADRLLQGRFGINQMPTSGGHRNWMRSVVEDTRKILKQRYGLDITNADLQAILWYPEKDIYGKLGSKDTSQLNVSYADAMRQLMARRGTTQ